MKRGIAGLAFLAAIGCSYAPHTRIPEHREYTAPVLDPDSQAVSYVMDKIDNYKNIIFGENHAVESDDLFFAGLVPYFRQHGIDNIALEISRTYQPEMDAYLATGVLPNDPDHFINWVYNGEKGAILKAAKENKIKVWCIDAEESEVLLDLTRDLAMFEFMKDNFVSKEKKAAVLIGSWHIAESVYSEGRVLIETLGALLEKETGGSSFSLLFDSPIWSVSHGLTPYRQSYTAYDFDNTELGRLPAPLDGCGEDTTMEQCFDGVLFVPQR